MMTSFQNQSRLMTVMKIITDCDFDFIFINFSEINRLLLNKILRFLILKRKSLTSNPIVQDRCSSPCFGLRLHLTMARVVRKIFLIFVAITFAHLFCFPHFLVHYSGVQSAFQVILRSIN